MPILWLWQKDGGEVPAQEMLKGQQCFPRLDLGCAPIPKPSPIMAELKLLGRSSWSLVLEAVPSPPLYVLHRLKTYWMKTACAGHWFWGDTPCSCVCFQRYFACSSLHMRNEISRGKKDGCRVAARIVSSCFLSLLASKAEFGVNKGRAGIITAKDDFVYSGCPAVCPVCWRR